MSKSNFSDISSDESSEEKTLVHSEDEEELEMTETEQKHLIQKYGLGFKNEILPVYDSDTSDEDNENVVGNIPMKWYDDYDHIGYNKDGNKIAKPASKDELDKFLSNSENGETWKTVINEMGESVLLTKEDLEIIKRIEGGQYGDVEYNPYEPTVEWFTSKTEIMPLSAAPEPKSRFIPSKHEAKKIMKMARAIRKGWLKPRDQRTKHIKAEFFDIWADSKEVDPDIMHIPAPKLRLPGNEESYNPPEEYLKTPLEIEELQKESDTPIFIPKKFASIRQVPLYDNFIQDIFERCLDLYLCPRMIKKRINIDPESLIPKLPNPKDLEPFPSTLSIIYKGHSKKITSISIDPKGFWMASASEDNTVRIWEISTGRCAVVYKFDDEPLVCKWNPNSQVLFLAVAVDKKIHLINPNLEIHTSKTTDLVFEQEFTKNKNDHCTWSKSTSDKYKEGYRITIELSKPISSFSWHRKGDYFVTVSSTSSNSTALVHQISKWESQNPFQKSKGLITAILFHPSKPFLFIAMQKNVRIYNLTNQQLVKKLIAGVKWISSMDIHPQGDNLIIGSFDRRLCWFDMDLSCKPYKTLRYHNYAVRDVVFHKKLPLFASCSDDGSLNIFHGMVYNDLVQNPLIVPLTKIKAHETGSTCIEYHPNLPWIFSSGADGLHLDSATARTAGYTENADIKALEAKALNIASEVLRQYGGDIANIGLGLHIINGDPRDTLIKAIDEFNIDIVVVGNRGVGTIKRFVLGSVSDHLTKNASCSVVIIKSV